MLRDRFAWKVKIGNFSILIDIREDKKGGFAESY